MVKEINRDIEILKKKARTATIMDLQTAVNLSDTLAANKDYCVGMAANMIGVPVAIIAVYDDDKIIEMINPSIIKKSKSYKTLEGCLSLVGERETTRYSNLTVSWSDRNMKKHTENFTGFVAQTIQHEIDHVNGIII